MNSFIPSFDLSPICPVSVEFIIIVHVVKLNPRPAREMEQSTFHLMIIFFTIPLIAKLYLYTIWDEYTYSFVSGTIHRQHSWSTKRRVLSIMVVYVHCPPSQNLFLMGINFFLSALFASVTSVANENLLAIETLIFQCFRRISKHVLSICKAQQFDMYWSGPAVSSLARHLLFSPVGYSALFRSPYRDPYQILCVWNPQQTAYSPPVFSGTLHKTRLFLRDLLAKS